MNVLMPAFDRLRFYFGVPGLVLQFSGACLEVAGGHGILPGLAQSAGTSLLTAGLAMFAKAKDRSALWCLPGFLSLLGLFIMAGLEDRFPVEPDPEEGS